MAAVPTAESISMSQEWFMDPRSYGLFDTLFKRICMDPRPLADQVHGEYEVVPQVGGGAVGVADDTAMGIAAENGKPVSINNAMWFSKSVWPNIVFGAHYRCALAAALIEMKQEQANPQDLTKDSFFRWTRYLGVADELQPLLPRLQVAADRQQEHLQAEADPDTLMKYADRLHPEHHNVVDVVGENIARLYGINLDLYHGQNRNKKPADKEGEIQGYHDNPGVSLETIRNAGNLERKMRGLIGASTILRAAATMTIVAQDKLAEMTFVEVLPAPESVYEIEIIERKVA